MNKTKLFYLNVLKNKIVNCLFFVHHVITNLITIQLKTTSNLKAALSTMRSNQDIHAMWEDTIRNKFPHLEKIVNKICSLNTELTGTGTPFVDIPDFFRVFLNHFLQAVYISPSIYNSSDISESIGKFKNSFGLFVAEHTRTPLENSSLTMKDLPES